MAGGGENDRPERRAEADGATIGEAKWNAIKALDERYPGIDSDSVTFELLDEGDPDEGRPARVRAEVDPERWRRSALELPNDAAERVRAIVSRVTRALGLRASVEVEETEDEIRATVNGEELGLLIGKHGATIDALQHIAWRAAFRGERQRKNVVLDAAGYRERRAAALERAADQAAADALSFGRPVELEPMTAPERRVVHTYLRDRLDVQTHSEGEEPDRRLVVTPLRGSRGG